MHDAALVGEFAVRPNQNLACDCLPKHLQGVKRVQSRTDLNLNCGCTTIAGREHADGHLHEQPPGACLNAKHVSYNFLRLLVYVGVHECYIVVARYAVP